ncbi:MAG TPA: SET domain-containing protein-lysine N-methyltransferase [Chitinophagaceae bacterium]|nr:SET domain-containing protein-lysine N-methyltransferase [Chitinophagaceae bacterium]
MILPSLYIHSTRLMDRGVFTEKDIEPNRLIEVAPVIVMSAEEKKLLDQTALHDYIFEWGEDDTQCCMAMGYVPVYNHSYHSNCEYIMDYQNRQISIKTVRKINAGEELFINYNGNWNDESPLWFDAQ